MGLGEGVSTFAVQTLQPAVPIGKVALWMQTKLFLTLCPGLRTQHTFKTEELGIFTHFSLCEAGWF